MLAARKAIDLLRDPRAAFHSGSDDPPDWQGDAKVAGRAVVSTDWARAFPDAAPDPNGSGHLFRLDVTEVSVVRLAGDHLEVSWWTPERGVQSVDRG